jgi:hypothetical protein
MERFKWIAGDALLRVAQVCATAGRRLLGTPRTTVVGDHPARSQTITLETRMPLVIVKAIRLVGPADGADEIRKVVRVDGRRVTLDCPTMNAYPHGAEARPLI